MILNCKSNPLAYANVTHSTHVEVNIVLSFIEQQFFIAGFIQHVLFILDDILDDVCYDKYSVKNSKTNIRCII